MNKLILTWFLINMLGYSEPEKVKVEEIPFKSLPEIRLSHADYGPNFEEIFPYTKKTLQKVISCNLFKVEKFIDPDYAPSSSSVGGKKLLTYGGVISLDSKKLLLELISKYSSYGDSLLGVIKPPIAIEFIAGKESFILHYCPKTKSVFFSDSRVNADYQYDFSGSVVTVSPKLANLLDNLIKENGIKTAINKPQISRQTKHEK